MKNKLLFLFVMVMAMICLTVAASAASIDDVVFKNGTNEVFVVGAGSISAAVDITVAEETSAALVTAAYEGNRLAAVQYEGITLSPTQKTYQGSPVTATANTTNVDVMVWGINDLSPIDTKESLTSISREIRVTDFTVTDDTNTFNAVVNNARKTVTVEQIVDIYKDTNYGTTYSKYYNERPLDFPSLANATANYKLNGVSKTNSIDLNSPATISVEAANGRKADYTVVVDKHIAAVVANMDFNNTPTFDTSTANRIRINQNQSKTQFFGTGRYGSGAIDVTCLTGGHDIQNYQDTSLSAYYNVSYVQRSEGNNCLKTVKLGNTGGAPAIHLYEGGSYWGSDKSVYSFDFMCEAFNSGSALVPQVMGVGSVPVMTLNFERKSGADALYLTYTSSTTDGVAEGFGGYGKRLAEIPFGKWVNVKMIIDKDAQKPFIVCLDNEVILETTHMSMATSALPGTFSGNVVRLGTYSSTNATVYLDNIMEYYSQVK